MSNMQTANTILAQLGGNRFAVMTGAKNFIGGENTLTFRLPARFAQKSITGVRVTLDLVADLYKVEFLAIRGLNVRTVSEFDGVYAEDLRDLFETETGLYTSLGTMGRA
jgi:hypothetical protein